MDQKPHQSAAPGPPHHLQNQQQQCQQQQQFQNPSSPRKKKAPLDLDAALFIQSQASYVQEPNIQSISASRGAPLCQPAPASGQSGPQAHLQSAAAPSRTAQAQQQVSSAVNRSNSNSNSNSNNFPLEARHHLRPSPRLYYSSAAADISVDYIDCLSNDDLSSATAANKHSLSSTMCTKRQPRFHRNRVEPSADAAASATGENCSSSSTTTGAGESSSGCWLEPPGLATNLALDGGQNNSSGSASSVLYPISVSQAKKEAYLVGSLGQADSLLGHEELSRYFPNNRVSIFVCTWNQNRRRAPQNLADLLLPDQLVCMPDIYAIGIQEAFSSQSDYLRDWEIELQTTLGLNHVLLHSCSLGVLHLALFVRRDLIWFCSMPEESLYNSRSMPTNMIKTKGAISIAFRFFGTSFMFTNCHFPAHENKLKDRIDEYQRIINSIDLPKNLKLLKPRYLSNDSTARFDCVFFMGDLNFRLEQRTFDETISILEDILQQPEPSYETLTQNDELMKVMESGQAFHGFDESPIRFPPTYKFLAQTNKYDKQTKRVPSYTDRILFRSKRQRHIQCLLYDWLPQLLSSDHKPVYSLFDVLIRPGHEQNMTSSLNAGLFQRSIYLEALKRRAEDPEALRENGAGASLICSIS